MPIKVLIVEDNPDLRQALKSLIALSDDFVCVGDYGFCQPEVFFEGDAVPDVILMDIDLPGENGISYTRRIKEKYPFINILMLTVVEQEDKIIEAIYAGATGYLIKSAIPENILENIRILYRGGSPLTPSIARIIFQNVQNQQPSKKEKVQLNTRETEVLSGLVKGLTYKMIAAKHFISVDTVRSYIRCVYEKLEVHSRSEAIVRALNDKLV
nr:response regulator transcription factor [uncultured Mucilaginibacter sp.]